MSMGRSSLLVIALVLACAVTRAWTAPPATEQALVVGKDYTRLADWALANKFQMSWLKPDETLEVSNRAATLVLTIDSREARINGVEVFLLFPLIQRDRAVWITRSDLQTTLRPILHPARNPRGERIMTVCLDPGHGGKDPGFRLGAREEKKYTLLLAQDIRRELIAARLKVVCTRTTDSFVELATRPEIAKRRGADLFVSLHFNSANASASTVQGAEVYCLPPAGAPSTNEQNEGGSTGRCAGNRCNERNMFLAFQIQKALTRDLPVQDRGVRRARFAVLRDALMPGVLIEAGFMSHPTEGRRIFDAGFRRQLAHAIANGLLAYKHQLEQGN